MRSCMAPRRMVFLYLSILGLLDKVLCTAPRNYSLFGYTPIIYPEFYTCAACDICFQVGYFCLLFFAREA